MPAHLRSIVRTCQVLGFTKTATVELYNTFNARMGVYCQRHGDRELLDFRSKHETDLKGETE